MITPITPLSIVLKTHIDEAISFINYAISIKKFETFLIHEDNEYYLIVLDSSFYKLLDKIIFTYTEAGWDCKKSKKNYSAGLGVYVGFMVHKKHFK